MRFLSDPPIRPRAARLRGALAALALAASALASAPARADEAPTLPATPQPFAYGILVGANEGGPGQETLRYAEDDARRVAAVLRELGRYPNADLRVLARPHAADVARAIDEVGAKLRAHRERGEQDRQPEPECAAAQRRHQPLGRRVRDVQADHEHRAVREIDDPRDPEDQGQADGDQEQRRRAGQPVEQLDREARDHSATTASQSAGRSLRVSSALGSTDAPST